MRLSCWNNQKIPYPLAEKFAGVSSYTYCMNNPIIYVDPDGMVATSLGDFINEKGKLIGNDGKNDGKVYVIKTTKTGGNDGDLDSKVNSSGITKDQAKATEIFIKANSGNTAAFENNTLAYDNSVEIEGSLETRQAMLNVANNDNGTEPSNHHEYGASISNTGVVGETEIGPEYIPGVTKGSHAEVSITTDKTTKSIMHTHQSYEKIEGEAKSGEIKYGGTITTYNMNQAPSQRDINNAGTRSNYVFGMRAKTVFIYNSTGVVATIPMNRFVTPKQ